MRWLWLLGALAWLLTACNRTLAVTPQRLLDEGRADELAAFSHYRDRALLVEGVMFERSLRSPPPQGGSHVPVVLMRDPRVPQSGIVLCYFEPSAVDRVAQTPNGSLIRVHGRFQTYYRHRGEFGVVLNRCQFRHQTGARQ